MTETRNSLLITRVIDAPRERVWRLWTDPEELARWWWPERFHTRYEVDLREGGAYRFRTAPLPDIGIVCVMGEFLEVRPPELLVYTWRWESADETPSLVRVELVEAGDRTELRIRHDGLPDGESRKDHAQGWSDCLDRLAVLDTS